MIYQNLFCTILFPVHFTTPGFKSEGNKISSEHDMKLINMTMKGQRLKSSRRKREVSTNDCEYSWYDKCGDKCLLYYSDCKCGEEKFNIRTSSQYCCVSPSDTCTGDGVNDVDCPTGEVKNITESCDGVCYNSYQHSQYLVSNAHYSYEEGDKCVSVKYICQGISYSDEDVEICKEELKCIEDGYYPFKQDKLEIVEEHHYCNNDDQYKNNGKFDIIDRSDKENINVATVTNIDYTE